MSHRYISGRIRPFARRRRWCTAAIVLGFALIHTHGASAQSAGGDAADVETLAREYAAAGEFSPAIALADRQTDAALRDRMFGQIAVAQAGAGARSDSISTAGRIRDDLIRSSTLSQAADASSEARGGGVQPDFESLIDLIIETIEPESWSDVGGPGAIREFEAGVRVDAQGVMRRVLHESGGSWLDQLRSDARSRKHDSAVRAPSAMRKVSLVRLERAVQLQLAAGRPLDEEMELLAGLQRIEYVLLYPDSGDLVLAGPAGDWKRDDMGRAVASDTRRPVVRLDNLVVVLRHMMGAGPSGFGCSIEPRAEALARAQQVLAESSTRPLRPGERDRWLARVRDAVGLQDVVFYGVDPATHVASVLLEADHHMKLVGIGLEEGTLNVSSYLDMIEVPAGGSPPPMGVLRWWFTMNYDALLASPQHDAFHLQGQGVRVQSENELLTEAGRRVHTGRSDELNQQFAHNFTHDFEALAQKYPVYAELQNIFDLALVGALFAAEDLPEQVGWHMTCFGDEDQFAVATGRAPLAVETVVNHRVIRRKHIVAGVSGGVRVDPSRFVARSASKTDGTGALNSHYERSAPEDRPTDDWWWD